MKLKHSQVINEVVNEPKVLSELLRVKKES